MKFKHNFLTPLILMTLFFCIMGFTILTLGKSLVNKKYILEITKKIDLVEIIKNDESLNKILEEKIIPKEVLDNINEEKSRKLIEKIIDSLYSDKSSIIESSDISLLIKESVLEYENKTMQDIYNNIEKEIEEYSTNFISSINDENFINTFRTIYNITNGTLYYAIILFGIISILIIIYLEKKEAILILGIIFFLSSLIINYLKDEFISLLLENKELIELIGNNNILKIKEFIKPIYLIFFLISLILLIVYLIIFIKKLLVKIRLAKYDSYYGR